MPSINISELLSDLVIKDGELQFQNFHIGKRDSTQDDLIATVSGKITLNPILSSSTLNLRTNFMLSKKIQTAFVLIDTLLRPGKQTDGSYAYKITGTMNAPLPTPIENR